MSRSPAVSGRILIVDDDERQRMALAGMLSGSNFEIQVAADGQFALDRLATFNADVIVADLVMPRMDGFELLRKLHDRGGVSPADADLDQACITARGGPELGRDLREQMVHKRFVVQVAARLAPRSGSGVNR